MHNVTSAILRTHSWQTTVSLNNNYMISIIDISNKTCTFVLLIFWQHNYSLNTNGRNYKILVVLY